MNSGGILDSSCETNSSFFAVRGMTNVGHPPTSSNTMPVNLCLFPAAERGLRSVLLDGPKRQSQRQSK